jgi:hypothetical protein
MATMATIHVRSRSFVSLPRPEVRLNHAVERTREITRERPLRVDKLGVTGSSPVPPIDKVLQMPMRRCRSWRRRSIVWQQLVEAYATSGGPLFPSTEPTRTSANAVATCFRAGVR